MIDLLLILASIVILLRCICLAGRISIESWDGHSLRFVGVAISYAMIGAGALGTALAFPHGSALLLFGTAGWVVFDRRKYP